MPVYEQDQSSRLVFELDLEIHVNYSGDNPDFDKAHAYTIVRYTEESVLQACSFCNRPHQAAKRATVKNNATGIEYYSGLDCLRNNFGVTEAELHTSSRNLKRLAMGWQAYCTATGFPVSELSTTKAVVEDMHEFFKKVPALTQATGVLRTILHNLAEVQQGIYTDEIEALIDLLGILFESGSNAELLNDRQKALGSHPLLDASQQQTVQKVLGNTNNIIWSDLLQLSKTVRSIRNRTLSTRTPEAPPHQFPSPEAYWQGLRTRCNRLANEMTERDGMVPARLYPRTLREAVDELTKKKGGVTTFAFESKSGPDLDDLVPSHAILTSLSKKSGGISQADFFRSYRHVESRQPQSLRGMQRESQMDETSEHKEPIVREGFYRGVVAFLPEPYLPFHQILHKHGEFAEARKKLEDFTSSLQ